MKMGIFTSTGYSKSYCLLHPWVVITHKFKDIRCAWQRATKGYCYRDVWNIDNWFLKTVPQMLDDLIKIHNGHPSGMTDEEWVDILNEMSTALKNADEETTEFVNPYTEPYLSTLEISFDNGKLLCHADEKLEENYYTLETEKEAFVQKSLAEGMNLFQKYFRDLWD